MKCNDDDIELPQHALRCYRAAAVVPDALSVDINVACGIPLLGKIREDRRARLERDFLLSRRATPPHSHDSFHAPQYTKAAVRQFLDVSQIDGARHSKFSVENYACLKIALLRLWAQYSRTSRPMTSK